MTRAYSLMDVFTDRPFLGNPLAVVHEAAGLTVEDMQVIARWTQLSETTFLLPPTDPAADYRVRIFTPGGELPFAGHPTLGSCCAWEQAGGVSKASDTVVQQCGVGLVRIRREGRRRAFAAPPLRSWAVSEAELAPVVQALGLPRTAVLASQWLDNGPVWLGLLLDSAERVLGLEPDHAALKPLAKVGVVAPQAPGQSTRFEVRAFAAAIGVAEDPVTGSLNASLARWLMATGAAPAAYVAAQGQRLGRAGRVHLSLEGDDLWVGGHTVGCVQGQLSA